MFQNRLQLGKAFSLQKRPFVKIELKHQSYILNGIFREHVIVIVTQTLGVTKLF